MQEKKVKLSSINKLNELVECLKSVKAIGIEIIDVQKAEVCFDQVIICSGSSIAHVRGITDKLDHFKDIKPQGIEGRKDYNWVLADYGEIIIHILLDEIRQIYALEELYNSWLEKQTEKLENIISN